MKPRLSISFSGGKTSAVMTRLLLDKYRDTHNIAVVFANTGCEHEATLEFVRDCDHHFGFGTVWIEAIIGPPGVGPRAKIVDFETARRNGEPFEAAVAKHGVFGPDYPNCTGRLKSEPLHAYLRDHLGWRKGTYKTAIGIRADEFDRMSASAKKERLVYPLVSAGWTRQMVDAEVDRWPFGLNIPEHYGNCVWCWKKSKRKLLTLAQDDPAIFDFPARMEAEHGQFKADNAKGRRTFFRGEMSAEEIVEEGQRGEFRRFEPALYSEPDLFPPDPDLDIGSSCGESCEIGADE